MTVKADGSWFTLRWGGDAVELLDQRVLPELETIVRLDSVEAVAQAIEALVVRGAPAIGCTAALGMALAARIARDEGPEAFDAALAAARERLAATRPTAVNLFWALGRIADVLERTQDQAPRDRASEVLAAALQMVEDDVATCRAIGRAGTEVVPRGARILTHCNAGALATAGYGTALGVVRAAVEAGLEPSVLADETRPFLQGARLTAWELARDGVPVTVIADSMAGHLMQRGEVDLVVVGADRIAANGDVANKIGTYGLAVLAHAHGVPFYVAAPLSTVDPDTPDGSGIPIEERSRDEVARIGEREVVPRGVPVRHPAFDVTPARLIRGIVTERGIARAPYGDTLKALLAQV